MFSQLLIFVILAIFVKIVFGMVNIGKVKAGISKKI
jgi:hypothetical protein